MTDAAAVESAFTREAFTLLSIGVFFVTLREASRIMTVGMRGLCTDDYVMVLASVIYALETTTAYAVGAWWHGLANSGLNDQQRIDLDTARLSSPKGAQEWAMRQNGSKTQLVGWSLYTLLLWLLKLCMCIFYGRFTQDLEYMKWRIRAGYIIIIATYLATELAILLGCRPFHRNWQIHPDPGNHCQPAISHVDLYVTVILNVVSDMLLLLIPMPILWRAELPLSKRLSLMTLFSGAIFVMAAGCLRCALIIRDPVGGAQQAGTWAVRETFVAVIVTNLPIVYQGYRKLIHPKLVRFLHIRPTKFSSRSEQRSLTSLEPPRVSLGSMAKEISLSRPPTPPRARWLRNKNDDHERREIPNTEFV